MTLISSNKNHLLFNIENSNKLLRLSYGHRFTNLLNDQTVSKQKSTAYKLYFSLFVLQSLVLQRKPNANFSQEKTPSSTLGTESFDTIRLSRIERLEQNARSSAKVNAPLPQSILLLPPIFIDPRFSKAFTEKLCKDKTSILTTWLKKPTLPSYRYKEKKILRLYKSERCKQRKNLKEEVPALFPKEKKNTSTKNREQNFVQKGIDSRITLLISDNFNHLKKNFYAIKQFAPKLRIWSFAFGSSFFLIGITSILQRQEQNRWFFTFSRSVLPGLYLTSEESSWECFENVTLKYLSRKCLPYRNPNTKNLVKKIDCYKDILYLGLSESWNQQVIQNYTAVFFKCDNPTLSQNSLFSNIEEEGQAKENPEKKDGGAKQSVTKSHLVPHSYPQREGSNHFFFYKNFSLKNEYLVQPWYQIYARVPPKKEITKNIKNYNQQNLSWRQKTWPLSLNRNNFFKPKRNIYKERLSIENDSIPSKMSSSASSNFKRGTLHVPYIGDRTFAPITEGVKVHSLQSSVLLEGYRKQKKEKLSSSDTKRSFNAPTGDRHINGERAHALSLKDVKLYNSIEKGKAKNYIDSPNDIIKNLFYEYDNLCVDPKAFSPTTKDTAFLPEQSLSLLKKENSDTPKINRKFVSFLANASLQKEAFEKVIYRDRFSFLQKESFFKLPSSYFRESSSPKVAPFFCKLFFDSPQGMPKGKNLIYDDSSQIKIDLEQKDHLYKSRSFWYGSKIGAKTATNTYTHFKESRLKMGEKISSYLLLKRKTVSNRFMSGYQQPETKKLRIKRSKNKFICGGNTGIEFSIKVPPSLPFYESKVKALRNAFNPTFKDALTELKQNRALLVPLQKVKREKKDCLVSRMKSVTALKKMPYRELSLNEKGEVEPLFEQVNKTFYFSPYRFVFKKSLFADYNDYLSWPKDNPVAISISPFIEASIDEKERAVKDSWLASSPETKVKPGYEKPSPLQVQNGALQEDLYGLGDQSFALVRPRTSEPLQEQELHPSSILQKKLSQKKEKKGSTVFFAEGDEEDIEQYDPQKRAASEDSSYKSLIDTKDNLPVEYSNLGEEEEKKREITKSEWLEQIRESEHSLEKRKDLQKWGYPKKKALDNRSLQRSPGKIHSLLVSDRKASFFGITNLFPKRLISEDQKQIASQILRDGIDRESVSLLESLNQKYNEKTSPEEGDFFDSQRKQGFRLSDIEKPETVITQNKTSQLFSESINGKKGVTKRSFNAPTGHRHESKAKRSLRAQTCTCKPLCFKQSLAKIITRQHPIYTPNRRLRLRVPQALLALQNSNNQARIDDLNLSSSHRWWQKRRISSSLLGAPSKRYLVMPEITTQDWRKIIEWQLKIYFLEEEKRLLQLQKGALKDISLSSEDTSKAKLHLKKNNSDPLRESEQDRNANALPFVKQTKEKVFSENPSFVTQPPDTKQLFTIKKLAIYLPWTSLKKSLKKPFEWPVTLLSYSSFLQPQKPGLFGEFNRSFRKGKKNKVYTPNMWFCSEKSLPSEKLFSPFCAKRDKNPMQNFIRNKKTDSCFVSSISPPFKSAPFFVSNKSYKSKKSNSLCKAELCKNFQRLLVTKNSYAPEKAKLSDTESYGLFPRRGSELRFPSRLTVNQLDQSHISKPFLFEAQTQNSYLLLHGLLLIIAIKRLFGGLYKIFGTLVLSKIKNSSLSVLLLPFFFNTFGSSNSLYSFDDLKTRAKHLAGSEDTISSLSEIVWYLRNSCRGRLVPRGVVLVEKFSSESTNFLKAIGGEAQVPVIVQSLRALPYTQNHPQRQLEKILTFAQKQAPCILFLDDLDSIGQERTLLLKNNGESCKSEICISTFKSWRQKTPQSEKYWVRNLPPLPKGLTKHLPESKFIKGPILFGDRHEAPKLSFGKKLSFYKSPCVPYISFTEGNGVAKKVCTWKGGGEKRKWKRYKNNLDKPFSIVTKTVEPSHLENANSCKAFLKSSYSHNSSLDKSNGTNGFNHSRLPIKDLYARVSTDSYKSSYKSKICRSKSDVILNKSSRALKGGDQLEKANISSFDAHPETEKVVEQRRVDLMLRLLTVMDGISGLNGVLIVTTSKNPSRLDPALLRPGRFEKLIHLKLPTKKKRISLLKRESARLGHTNPMPWEYLGRQTQDMTGSDIASAVNHSAFRAIMKSTIHTFPTLEYGINRVDISCKAPIYKTICTKNKFLVHNSERAAMSTSSSYNDNLYLKLGQRSFSFRFPPEKDDFTEVAFFLGEPYNANCSTFTNRRAICPYKSSCMALQSEALYSKVTTFATTKACLCPVGTKPRSKACSMRKSNTGRKIFPQISFYKARKGVARPLILSSSFYKVYSNIQKTNTNLRFVTHRSPIQSFALYVSGCNANPSGKKSIINKSTRAHTKNFASFCMAKPTFATVPFLAVHLDTYKAKLCIGDRCKAGAKVGFAEQNLERKWLLQGRKLFDKVKLEASLPQKTSALQVQSGALQDSLYGLRDRSFDAYSPSVTGHRHAKRFALRLTNKKFVCVNRSFLRNKRFSEGLQGLALLPFFYVNFLYYNMVLTCFYVAFQNCTENRELLDFVTDHLIRFKVLKLHEMLRIVLFYY